MSSSHISEQAPILIKTDYLNIWHSINCHNETSTKMRLSPLCLLLGEVFDLFFSFPLPHSSQDFSLRSQGSIIWASMAKYLSQT